MKANKMLRIALKRQAAGTLALVAVAAAAIAGCMSASQITDEAAAWKLANAEQGRTLFSAVCSGCHGADGRAQVAVRRNIFPRPRNLTLGEYRFRTTASGTLPIRDDVLRTISKGLPGTAMPSWGDQLSRRQMMAIVVYLETLAPLFQDEDFMPEEDDILVNPSELKAPPATAAMLTKGAEVYKTLKCWECHGETGIGDGPSAPTLKNQDGTRALAFNFTFGVFKGGNTPEDVYRTFMTGLDGTPMPSYSDSIPEEGDRWALVHYVLSLTQERGVWFYLTERPTWNEPMMAD